MNNDKYKSPSVFFTAAQSIESNKMVSPVAQNKTPFHYENDPYFQNTQTPSIPANFKGIVFRKSSLTNSTENYIALEILDPTNPKSNYRTVLKMRNSYTNDTRVIVKDLKPNASGHPTNFYSGFQNCDPIEVIKRDDGTETQLFEDLILTLQAAGYTIYCDNNKKFNTRHSIEERKYFFAMLEWSAANTHSSIVDISIGQIKAIQNLRYRYKGIASNTDIVYFLKSTDGGKDWDQLFIPEKTFNAMSQMGKFLYQESKERHIIGKILDDRFAPFASVKNYAKFEIGTIPDKLKQLHKALFAETNNLVFNFLEYIDLVLYYVSNVVISRKNETSLVVLNTIEKTDSKTIVEKIISIIPNEAFSYWQFGVADQAQKFAIHLFSNNMKFSFEIEPNIFPTMLEILGSKMELLKGEIEQAKKTWTEAARKEMSSLANNNNIGKKILGEQPFDNLVSISKGKFGKTLQGYLEENEILVAYVKYQEGLIPNDSNQLRLAMPPSLQQLTHQLQL